MDLPLARSVAGRFEWLPSAASTNDVLVRWATGPDAEDWGHLSAVATTNQTAGRGRIGRSWVAEPGTALALSVLVRPAMPVTAFGWLPLLAGSALAGTLRAGGAPAAVKWPNDVLIGDRKVSGILSELLPDLAGAVVGVGVNTSMRADQLPVPTATSLAVEGVSIELDAVIAGFLGDFSRRIDELVASGGDAIASGARDAVAAACGTIGRPVRVVMPDGGDIVGEAVGLDGHGRLLVARHGAATLAVAAGDVTHLRYQ